MRKRRRPLKWSAAFSLTLGAPRNPTAEKTEHDACNHQNNEDKENRLLLVKVNQLTHPSNHLSEKFADLRKQRTNDGSSSSLKSSSFHKNIYGNLSRTQQENQHREYSSENNEITNLGDSKNAETILQRKKFHQLMRPQIAFLIQVTVVTKTRTTSKAETQACGLRT